MIASSVPGLGDDPFDIVILGGAVTGSSLGVLLLREFPDLRIAIVEKSEMFDRKVGESTSEVGACYLTKVLHLGDYLPFEHVTKQGLRMWFHQKEGDTVCDCSELGPRFQSRLPGYQLDRSKLDQHLLEDVSERGATVLRPVTVREIRIPEENPDSTPDRIEGTVEVRDSDGETATLRARWIIDASGKAALLGRQRGTLVSMEGEHPTSSMWCRFHNVRSLESEEAREACPSLRGEVHGHRGLATNHLAGFGWWSWIIPLKNGDHSLGITWDRRLFEPPEADGTIPGRIKEHVLKHPVGRLMFEDARPNEKDARFYKSLAYYNREVAGDGWAICGDAAGFMDPLYSQGLDYCGHTAYAVFDILRTHFRGDCSKAAVMKYAESYPSSYRIWMEALYRDKYYYIGDAELMHAAFLLDLATYFIGPVKFVYFDTDREFAQLPFHGPIGRGVGRFMALYNRRLAVIARKRLAAGTYGRRNTGDCFLICRGFGPGNASLPHLRWGLWAWFKAEVNALFLRIPKEEADAAVPPVSPMTPIPKVG